VADDVPARRIACVDLPALPLQLVLRAHPEWREDPVVVVEGETALAPVLWANRPARVQRIVRGLRFGQAQSLAARVHAAVVEPSEIERALTEVRDVLIRLSPSVESFREQPGVFWLDPNGLERLHANVEIWAARVAERLDVLGFAPAVVVGWHPFRALAIARLGRRTRVLASPDVERGESARVPLARLADVKVAADMHVLGIATLGDFLRLPRGGLHERYGEKAVALHDLFSGRAWTPFRPDRREEPCRIEVPVEPPDDDPARLLFGIKAALHPRIEQLGARGRGVAALLLEMQLDHAPAHRERIEAASPTLDVARLLDLVRLRLASLTLAAPVEHVTIEIESRTIHARQSSWLPASTRRDRVAGARAFARLSAAFGEGAVTRARLLAEHLPERSFLWEPLRELPEPRPVELADGLHALARNLLASPVPLPDPPRHEVERWLGRFGAVEAMHGPGRVTSEWWDREIERDYFYLETKTGEVLWTFYDRSSRLWFLHGSVD
jgi:protein ImuB